MASRKVSGRPLNDRQLAFVGEYLMDRNATQAAVRAGYSPPTARAEASRLLANVAIRTAIRRETELRARAAAWTVEAVLTELGENVRAAREAGDLKASNDALELLGKHLGMWAPRAPVVNIDGRSQTLNLGAVSLLSEKDLWRIVGEAYGPVEDVREPVASSALHSVSGATAMAERALAEGPARLDG